MPTPARKRPKRKAPARAPAEPEPRAEPARRRLFPPTREKVGEDRGNLKRREEWFRRRSGA